MADNKDKKTDEPAAAPAMPSLVGFTPEQLQVLLGSFGTLSAQAMNAALRSQRKENPNYPERSVFNPAGVFDNDGAALPPKVRLSRVTTFVKVRLSDELLTPEEIALCNRFTTNKESRSGQWTAKIERKDGVEVLKILDDYSVKEVDARMTLPPFTHILRELLDGAESINPETMAKRIAALEAKLATREIHTDPKVFAGVTT